MNVCYWCGDGYEATSSGQIYCSKAHKEKQRIWRKKLLDNNTPIIPCPHPEKKVYHVRGVAVSEARRISKEPGNTRLYFYECQCGAFHHTKNYHPGQSWVMQ